MTEFVELECRTWGTLGQHIRDVAILTDGSMVDSCRIHRNRKIVVDGREYIIEVDVRDSRKNLNRTVYVPREIVAAVLRHTHKYGWEVVEGDGYIVEEFEERVKEKGRYRYRIKYRVVYYVDDKRGLKVALERVEEEFEKEVVGRPLLKVYVTVFGNKLWLCVRGDTYHVRDALKKLGFRWVGFKVAWCSFLADVDVNKLSVFEREYVEGLRAVVHPRVEELVARLKEALGDRCDFEVDELRHFALPLGTDELRGLLGGD